MPGVKGSGGRIPKRDNQRRRRNPPAKGPAQAAEGAAKVDIPDPDADWHPAARRWYESLAKSGQSKFYEPSDWDTAWLLAESLSRDLKPRFVAVDGEGQAIMASLPISGASMSSYLKGMGLLMVTEGDRRRARLELHRPQPSGGSTDGDVSYLDDLRRSKSS